MYPRPPSASEDATVLYNVVLYNVAVGERMSHYSLGEFEFTLGSHHGISV
ncbi:MAG: hypothetical protein QOJ40_2752 [Verrucomicrobiota bacterium]